MEHASRHPTAPPEPEPSSGLERMSGAIERDILPRLLQAHRAGPFPPGMLMAAEAALAREPASASSDEDAAFGGAALGAEAERVLELVRHLTAPEEEAVDAYLDGVLEDGVSCEAVYLDLLAPAARLLGTMWEEDTCDFVAVTVALGRMQRVLRSLGHLFLAGAATPGQPAGRIFLTCLPGEQHTLGLVMVAEFFVRAGWWTDLGHPVSEAELMQSVRGEWYDVVGVSMACDSSLPRLKRELQAIRRASRNPSVRLMVGGRAFDADPALVGRVGAHGTAGDARGAVGAAAALLAEAAAR